MNQNYKYGKIYIAEQNQYEHDQIQNKVAKNITYFNLD